MNSSGSKPIFLIERGIRKQMEEVDEVKEEKEIEEEQEEQEEPSINKCHICDETMDVLEFEKDGPDSETTTRLMCGHACHSKCLSEWWKRTGNATCFYRCDMKREDDSFDFVTQDFLLLGGVVQNQPEDALTFEQLYIISRVFLGTNNKYVLKLADMLQDEETKKKYLVYVKKEYVDKNTSVTVGNIFSPLIYTFSILIYGLLLPLIDGRPHPIYNIAFTVILSGGIFMFLLQEYMGDATYQKSLQPSFGMKYIRYLIKIWNTLDRESAKMTIRVIINDRFNYFVTYIYHNLFYISGLVTGIYLARFFISSAIERI